MAQTGSASPTSADAEEEEDDDHEEEMPPDLQKLTPDQQQAMIKQRAAMLCGLGTLLVVVFSDPMVDVMSNLGARIGVPPFYIAFVLAPLASNASELIASLMCAHAPETRAARRLPTRPLALQTPRRWPSPHAPARPLTPPPGGPLLVAGTRARRRRRRSPSPSRPSRAPPA